MIVLKVKSDYIVVEDHKEFNYLLAKDKIAKYNRYLSGCQKKKEEVEKKKGRWRKRKIQ
jgi:hypothetical protein